MKTYLCDLNKLSDDARRQAVYRRAADVIAAGGTVVFPTETVYGLGANGLDATALAKIFSVKGRPSDNPLILHIASRTQLLRVVTDLTPLVEKLSAAFWPGPLTLVLKKHPSVPAAATAGLDTVAVRWPAHPVATAVIAAADLPIAAPSANLSGQPSPTRAAHVVGDLMGKVDMILTAGDVQHGLESTVVDLTTSPAVILRPGAVTLEQLKKLIPDIVLAPAVGKDVAVAIPRAPGMKYRHYAPKADVYVVDLNRDAREVEALIEAEQRAGARVTYIDLPAAELAKELYALFREADADGYTTIFVRAVAQDGIGLAVMNRLLKAAEYRVI